MITSLLERQYITLVTEVDNFVVDTSGVLKKSIVAGTSLILYDKSNNQKSWFRPDEGVLIKSVYIRMPYQFTLADSSLFINLYGNVNPSTTYNFPEVGEPGSSGIPCSIENSEIEINTFIAPPPAAVAGNLKWQIFGAISVTFTGIAPAVSMVGAPTALNAATLPIYVGIKIVHAFALTAAP